MSKRARKRKKYPPLVLCEHPKLITLKLSRGAAQWCNDCGSLRVALGQRLDSTPWLQPMRVAGFDTVATGLGSAAAAGHTELDEVLAQDAAE